MSSTEIASTTPPLPLPPSLTCTVAAYIAATLASCTIAVSLTSLVPRLTGLSPGVRGVVGKLVPFFAVATAGCVNVGLMRWKEIRDGPFPLPPPFSN